MHEMRLSWDHIFLIHCELDTKLRSRSKFPLIVLRFTSFLLMHMIGFAIPFDLSITRVRPLLEVFIDAIVEKLSGELAVPSYV